MAISDPAVHYWRTFTTNKRKANVFIKLYAAVNLLNLSRINRSRIQQLKAVLKSPTVDKACRQPFQPSKMDPALRLIRSKEAAGLDDIPHSFLKAVGPRAKNGLLELFNYSSVAWNSTQMWKGAVILPLRQGLQQGPVISPRTPRRFFQRQALSTPR